MPGVDFVINALLETSGLRWVGDWARALIIARNRNTIVTKLAAFTGEIVMLNGQAAKHIACSWRFSASPAAAALWAARLASRSG